MRASIGVDGANLADDEPPRSMLRNADIAMYTAKSNGKNRIETFEPEMHAAAMTRLACAAISSVRWSATSSSSSTSPSSA